MTEELPPDAMYSSYRQLTHGVKGEGDVPSPLCAGMCAREFTYAP
jgi:hypothetical protein